MILLSVRKCGLGLSPSTAVAGILLLLLLFVSIYPSCHSFIQRTYVYASVAFCFCLVAFSPSCMSPIHLLSFCFFFFFTCKFVYVSLCVCRSVSAPFFYLFLPFLLLPISLPFFTHSRKKRKKKQITLPFIHSHPTFASHSYYLLFLSFVTLTPPSSRYLRSSAFNRLGQSQSAYLQHIPQQRSSRLIPQELTHTSTRQPVRNSHQLTKTTRPTLNERQGNRKQHPHPKSNLPVSQTYDFDIPITNNNPIGIFFRERKSTSPKRTHSHKHTYINNDDMLKFAKPSRTTGQNLVGLWRPSFTRVDQKLYLFGGGGHVTNDLHVLDLVTMHWDCIVVSFLFILSTGNRAYAS